MSGYKWTKREDDKLRRMHAEGKSLNACAREMVRGTGTVCQHAKLLGLSWDRSHVLEANIARSIDAAALRTALEVDLLEDAARLRKQLFAPVLAYNFGGKDNTFSEHKLKQPSSRDQLDIMKATTIAVLHSLKISEHDVTSGTEAAVGMLDKIADGIHIAALDMAIEEAV